MIQQVSGILFLITLGFIIIFSLLGRRRKNKTELVDSDVSFFIPCYNDETSVKQTIESIYKVAGERADVIVINDKSTDKTPLILQNLKKKYSFKLINNEDNLGKTASLNKYSHLTEGSILFFVDSDVVVNKKAFKDVLIRLSDKRVAAVSCPYVPLNKGFLPLMQHIEYNMLSLLQSAYNAFSSIALWGGFMAVKKNAFLKAGKFSLNAITEDMDMAFKLKGHGWKVEQSFSPIQTYVPSTMKEWFRQKIRWNAGSFQCFVTHWRIWIKNPIHIFFLLSYHLFIVSAVISLLILLMANTDYLHLLRLSLNSFADFKVNGFLHLAYFIKDLLWLFAFSVFSIPYVLPLIKTAKKFYLIFLVVPFSFIYIPMFSIVFIMGIGFFFYHLKDIKSGKRMW